MIVNTVSEETHNGSFLSQYYRSKIVTTVALVGAAVSVIYATLLLTLYDNVISCISDLFFATMYLFTLLFIKHNKIVFSTYWLVFWAGVQVSAGSALFVGPNTGFQLYFLTLPVLIYFLLWQEPIWARTSVITYGIVLFIISHTVYIPTFQANINDNLANTIFIANALIVFSITFLAVKFFADEIEKAYRQQEQLVLADRATNLPNERFITQHAQHMMAQCDRYGHPFSLINISLIQSKTNDHKLILSISDFLQSNCREADVLARTQNQQFTILLPETSIKETTCLIDRIICKTDKSTNCTPSAHDIKVKFGYAYCDSHSMLSIQELMTNAMPNTPGTLRI